MRRTILVLSLFACMLLPLAGCTNSQAELHSESTENPSKEPVLTESSDLPQEETPAPDLPEESGAALDTPVSGAAPTRQEAPADESGAPPSPKTASDPQDTAATVSPETAQPSSSQAEQPAESTAALPDPAAPTTAERPAETPVPAQPQEPEPEPTPEPEPPAFCIDEWISFAKSYAGSVGLALDSEAVYCWDTPITAGSHCMYLERDIANRLDRYARDGDIVAVWIWAESRGDGSYDLYIGYA